MTFSRPMLAVLGLLVAGTAHGSSLDPAGETAPDPLHDARRFASLMVTTAYRPSGRELSAGYLADGSPALRAFAERRIGRGPELARAISMLRPDYRRAVERCLPAAEALAAELPELLDATRSTLGLSPDTAAPRVAFLFGAGQSAGTVIDDTVILALEVVCRFATPGEDPLGLLRGFLVHEVVHVHQLRRQRPGREDSLLRQALLEGYADLVTQQVVGRPTPPARARARYGLEHEAQLWMAFRADLAGRDLESWLYGPGRPGEPADLGYWLGLRISEALFATGGTEAEVRRALLDLEDPFTLLERSAYGERFGPP